ncbi:MAG: Stk1 family PASTA domain-containing Ser/Thr kinase, partial [Propionibacterium acidifaciens]
MTAANTVLGGRYELQEIIGRGGMAEVWRARDVRLGRDIAVKRLRIDLATDPTFQVRFGREAQSAAGLNHPNIVSVYDTGGQVDEATGVVVPYIVMELVGGRTLRDMLRDGRTIEPAEALGYTRGVLDALDYSHKHGIIHRDIKPANVMITPTGQVKVMDFGIARAVTDTSATMTQTAAVIGTAQYLSPEQARGETVDSRSDIYSAGCLLYELLTGRPPFTGDSPVAVAYQHVRETAALPSTLAPKVTGAMDAITMTALAKNPNDRYQTARQMREDISRVLEGQQATAQMPAIAADTTQVALPAAPVGSARALPAEEE